MKIAFDGQTILVTGGTRGIGHQLAVEFSGLGANVILTGRDLAQSAAVAKALPGPGAHRALAVDLADTQSTNAFLEALAKEPRLDVLINNAGINRINPIDRVRDEDWLEVQRVNLEAPLRILRTASIVMKQRKYGRVVNVASIFGLISKSGRALYSMTKFGLRGLTVASALDLAPFGILVNTISPGFVRTELTESILSPEEQSALAALVPLGRFATTDEIARAILFLASPLNTYMTGQNLVVDGGYVSV